MRGIAERTSAGPARWARAAAIPVVALILAASAAPSRAGSSPDNAARAPSADNAAAPGANSKLLAAREAICRMITTYGNDIQDAYHRELLKNPKIEGEITVTFAVTPAGDVADLKVETSSLNWPALEAEILNRIRSWKFPAFEGSPIPATVPYKFGPK